MGIYMADLARAILLAETQIGASFPAGAIDVVKHALRHLIQRSETLSPSRLLSFILWDSPSSSLPKGVMAFVIFFSFFLVLVAQH